MNIKIDEVERSPIKLGPDGMRAWYEKELKRASTEIDRTKVILSNITTSVVMSGERGKRIAELNYAITVGTMYTDKLGKKIKELTK